MQVIYVGYSDPVFDTAQEISEITQDGCFSICEIVNKTGLSFEEVCTALWSLLEKDMCARLSSDGGQISSDERLVIMNHDLTVGKTYEVLGIEADGYRLLNDHSDPVLFHPCSFQVIDPTEPEFWVCEIDEDGERYCEPKSWRDHNLLEAFHDGVKEAQQQFWEDVKTLYPSVAK